MFDQRGILKKATLMGALAALPLPSLAAETAHLYLKANGVDILGDSTQSSLGRDGSIECVGFHMAVQTSPSGSPGAKVITCKKRIDKASPLLLKALAEQETLDFTFKFFRPSPTGDGTVEQYYTISSLQAGRLVSLEQALPSTVDAETAALPQLESLAIQVTGSLCSTFTSGGVTYCATVSPR